RHTRFSRDWSSDVCSSDLLAPAFVQRADQFVGLDAHVVEENAAGVQRAGSQLVDGSMRQAFAFDVYHEHRQAVSAGLGLLELLEIGRASCRERGCIRWVCS